MGLVQWGFNLSCRTKRKKGLRALSIVFYFLYLENQTIFSFLTLHNNLLLYFSYTIKILFFTFSFYSFHYFFSAFLASPPCFRYFFFFFIVAYTRRFGIFFSVFVYTVDYPLYASLGVCVRFYVLICLWVFEWVIVLLPDYWQAYVTLLL